MASAEGARRVFESGCPEATEELAERLGAALRAGDVVALSGELGAGKTTFVRGLARGLGVAEPATSPTFTLMHEHQGRVPLYHFDAWMAGREVGLLEGGGGEYLGGDGVAVVEWAERVEDWLPRPHLGVLFEHRSPRERRLTLTVVGAPDVADGPQAARAQRLLELLRGIEAEDAPKTVEEG